MASGKQAGAKQAADGQASGYLTRDEILAADDIATEAVEVPEWGTKPVLMRGLSGAERDALETQVTQNGRVSKDQISAKVVAASIVDGQGNKLFGSADVARLGAKSASALNRCMAAAMRLSRIKPEDVEEMAGNSETGQFEDSPSGSPVTSG